MKKLANAIFFVALLAGAVHAQENAGLQKPDADLPFTITQVATFDLPWRIAFLPDGRMLVTEKVGRLDLVKPDGSKAEVRGLPVVYYEGQNGMLGVFLSPHYADDQSIFLTYVEPGDYGGGLALGRAKLVLTGERARLDGFQVLWRQMPRGKGGQAGAQIAFSPDGNYLFLTVGDRQRMTPAQDPNQPEGKILRLTLDGKPAPGNPMEGKTGASTIPLIDPPSDTEAAKTAPVVSTYTFPGPNLTLAETWTSGHRTPYGLAFGPDGRLWELEHGPRGGDRLNLIEPGKNYGWPLVSYGVNYNGVPIPSPDTRPDLAKSVIYWVPVIAPGNLMFYKGSVFPWDGDALISGLGSRSIVRIKFDGKGGATATQRWSVDKRIRDIEEAPDGSLWMLEDSTSGGLYHLTPTQAPAAALPVQPPLAIPNPHYVSLEMEIDVNRPAAEVWKRVGKFCDIGEWFQFPCTILSGTDGEVGVVRSIGNELMVGKTELSYTYTQPVRQGQPYNLYHGTLEARPVTGTTSKLVYTLVFDNSMLADDAARDADVARRKAVFTNALKNMKTLAEGGTLPQRPAGGPGAAPAAPPAPATK